MSYRLIDSNALAMKYPEVNNMPCIYADLPNGLDCAHYSVNRFAKPKPGKWIYKDGGWHCSLCDEQAPFWCMASTQNLSNYCPNCGAKMSGDDWEEPEVNPCRGCDDYDGRGGCKSHGGCGAERSEEECEDEDWYTELDDPKFAERDEE